MSEDVLRKVTMDTIVGDTLTLSVSEHEIPLKLDTIRERADAKENGYECFTMVFSGPVDKELNQGTYTMKSEKLGDFLLFIVPVAKSQEAMTYEAVINRELAS
ncbi:hypothetical protein APED_12470 [Acanthopleuribacter pedis]